ncbi:hypothetical protein R5022_21420 [Pseudomonas aeruginosa]|uniref:Integrase n=2 Tax=Pseudomonas TaxID=286 RepID=A0A7W2K0Q4_9PSED|nr:MULTISPECIES: hypothetical protein [Pseudomonas]MBA6068663.1 hypothetical protein [Pseudomonas mosselii]MBN0192473.1 hypothetical protein [Pseudomonas aeruginosa]MBN1000362.1 hypothetical protein [Pseudomonas aeruginosa]PKF23777.1 hypothetical protein CW309_25565 [Pseudomonas hunanensis]RTB53108.1 hypothetical protein EJ654_25950 [Pseudomonas aeruginosa]
MGEIIHFVGKEQLSAKQNLEQYISHAKTNFPFTDVDWTSNSWDITSFNIGRSQGKIKKVAHFKSLRDESGSKSAVQVPFEGDFLNFAKAAFSETMRRLKLSEFKRHLYALQAIEQALLNSRLKPCITNVTPIVLDNAADLLKGRFKDPWHTSRVLERLVTEIINPARLTPNHLEWSSPIAYSPPVRNDRISPKQTEKVAARLPSLESILALADIHHTSKHVPDRVITSFVTLAMYAPSRSSEILSLPVNCLRNVDSEEGTVLGIAWAPAKGAQPMTKFAASDEFEVVIQKTVDYLVELGATARTAAAWYANNPTKIYLPPGTEHLRNLPITLHEASKILGKATAIVNSHAFRGYGLIATGESTNDKGRMANGAHTNQAPLFEFDSLEKYVLGKLPSIFPILDGHTGIKWHEALFIFPMNTLRPDGESLLYLPAPITTNQINNQLGANPKGVTIFSRNGKANQDGSSIAITTHNFRHLLNTLAQSKHLSEALIAFWSGRKNVSQNEWYDHIPQEAFIEAYLKMGVQTRALNVHGHLDKKVTSISVAHGLSREEALRMELGATHRTRYGICRHDHALTPCPKDKDCVSCSEHTFVKGDKRHKDEAEFQFKLHEKAVSDAQGAVERGEPGASRWLRLHVPKFNAWRQVLDLMNDPSITDGTLVTLPPPENAQSKAGLAEAVRIIGGVTQSIENKSTQAVDEDESLLLEMGFF